MDRKETLRNKALDILRKKGSIDSSLYEKDLESLVEELSIFQIEIEQQNAELMKAQEELEQTRARYEDLFQNAPSGYLILEENNKISDINMQARKILGLPKFPGSRMEFSQFIHSRFQDTFYFFLQTMRKGERADAELKFLNDHGETYVRLIGYPEILQNIKTGRYRITMYDIGYQKNLEDKLLKETEKAIRYERFKSTFLASMSHEIRTPLNGILGFASLLAEDEHRPEDVRNYASIIMRSGDRLMGIINDVLDISKIESGSMPVTFHPVIPSQIMMEVWDTFSAKAREKSLDFILNIPTELKSLSLLTDGGKLTQILNNLVGNALKFTLKGKVELGMSKTGKNLLFFVSDTGPGIPENSLNRLFEKFFQAEAEMNHNTKGSGLGLWLCKNLSEMLGGKLEAESGGKGGSVFRLTLPIPETESLSDEPAIRKDTQHTILVAEDDHINAEYMKAMLRKGNYKVMIATNGQEAVNIMEAESSISLILMDLKMPVLNGIEATKHIRAKRPSIPILAVTSYIGSSYTNEAIDAGCNEVLSKPLAHHTLILALEKYLV